MAGIVVKGKFPRRRTIQVVATNLVRYLFGGAARNWMRNISSTAPALGSMTLLLLLTGLVGLCGYAIHNLEQIEAGQAADIKTLAGKGGSLEKPPFKTPAEDFYLTNPIARASAVMAECSRLASGHMLTAAE